MPCRLWVCCVHVLGLTEACVADISSEIASLTAAQLLFLLSALSDSPGGSRSVALSPSLRDWLLDQLVGEVDTPTAVAASGVATKLLFHEDMIVVEAMQPILSDKVLQSLRQGGHDEGLAQNGLYLLRVLADLLGMAALLLPKATLTLLSSLASQHSHNEYLVGVAASLRTDLLAVSYVYCLTVLFIFIRN